ncbi:MAG: integrase core domain-containing protein, partial [Chloroflexota bacterium]
FRRDCLDHMVVLNETHLLRILQEFVRYYNEERPHRTLRLETPVESARPKAGETRSTPVLGGLHHVYRRAA